MTPATFERKLKNLEGMYRRLDAGQVGRNSAASDDWRERCYRDLRDAVAADARTDEAPLCAHLDSKPKLAARWHRLERRAVGLPVSA